MSGHSKWAQIKRQKAATDAKRGNLFTKMSNVISIAARDGGDPEMNPKLREAIDKARGANMPNANIERAIKRGTGELGGGRLEEVVYEGFGPGGAAVIIDAVTDNRNRTVATMRKTFADAGGTLGGENSVQWMFAPRSVIRVVGTGEQIELALIDAGAEDIIAGDNETIALFPPHQADVARTAITNAGQTVIEAEDRPVATAPVGLSDADDEKLSTFVETLERDDDVSAVYTNAGL